MDAFRIMLGSHYKVTLVFNNDFLPFLAHFQRDYPFISRLMPPAAFKRHNVLNDACSCRRIHMCVCAFYRRFY